MGGRARPTGAVNTTNTLPDYSAPYYNNLLSRAQQESYRPYEQYGGQRLANRPGDAFSADAAARTLAGSGLGGLQDAMSMFQSAGNTAGSAGNYAPGTFTNQNVAPGTISSNNISADNITAREWDGNAAQQYMSPYISQVLDQQTQRAFQDHQRAQIQRNTAATLQGNFNSGRHGVIDAMGNEEFTRQAAEINAVGLNQAWNQALQAFGGDRDAALAASRSNQDANLQAGLANQSAGLTANRSNLEAQLEAQRLNQSANLQTQQMGEQSRQFGANLGLQGLMQQIAAGQGLLQGQGLSDQLQTGRINLLNQQAGNQQAYQQAGLDIGYNDFLNQQNANRQNLNFLAQMIGILPNTTDQNSVESQYRRPLMDLLGVGIGALGTAMGSNGG